MTRFRFYVSIGALLSVVFAMLPITAMAFGAHNLSPYFLHPPILDAPAELRLQAVLHASTPPIAGDKRLMLLDRIDVRTALEDTARMRYELG